MLTNNKAIVNVQNRKQFDDYQTSTDTIRDILNNQTFLNHFVVPAFSKPLLYLEPSAGEGNWISTFEQCFSYYCFEEEKTKPVLKISWTAVEIQDKYIDKLKQYNPIHDDFLKHDFGTQRFDAIIGNPPYKYALQFAEKSLSLSDRVAFLLPLSFLAGQKRYRLMSRNPPSIAVLSKRPSFTGGGTAAQEYGMFMWVKEGMAPTIQFIEPVGGF